MRGAERASRGRAAPCLSVVRKVFKWQFIGLSNRHARNGPDAPGIPCSGTDRGVRGATPVLSCPCGRGPASAPLVPWLSAARADVLRAAWRRVSCPPGPLGSSRPSQRGLRTVPCEPSVTGPGLDSPPAAPCCSVSPCWSSFSFFPCLPFGLGRIRSFFLPFLASCSNFRFPGCVRGWWGRPPRVAAACG